LTAPKKRAQLTNKINMQYVAKLEILKHVLYIGAYDTLEVCQNAFFILEGVCEE